MDEQRIIEIETRLAYQDESLNELNRVMTDQQAQLTRLERATETLAARLQALAESDGGSDQGDERPPHY